MTRIKNRPIVVPIGKDANYSMDGWQYKAAFVIQFRPETDVKAERFEGRIEHIPSSRAIRFQSLDQLLTFIAEVLASVRRNEENEPPVR